MTHESMLTPTHPPWGKVVVTSNRENSRDFYTFDFVVFCFKRRRKHQENCLHVFNKEWANLVFVI